MKISEVISYWQHQQACVGDQELFQFEGDGRSTWVDKYKPRLSWTSEWPLPKGEKKWIVK